MTIFDTRAESKLRKALYSAMKRDFQAYGINMFANYPKFLWMARNAMNRVMKKRRARR